jgi:hypothetical protein
MIEESREEIAWDRVGLCLAGIFLVLAFAAVIGSAVAASMSEKQAAERAAHESLNATPVPTPIPTETLFGLKSALAVGARGNVTNETLNEVLNPEDMSNVTPVPTFSSYLPGGRELGQQFTWHRDNVSGLKDMDVNVTVWGYRMLPYYRYWYAGSGTYHYQQPDSGMKYLFVYVAIWVPGDVSTNDARLWLPAADHYVVQYKDKLIYLDPTYSDYGPYATVTIAELQVVTDYTNTTRIGYYGKHLALDYSGGVFLESDAVVHGGESNTISGFIIYQVPEDAQPEDIAVLGSFYAFGSAYWRLA